jgi:hypothetical protein
MRELRLILGATWCVLTIVSMITLVIGLIKQDPTAMTIGIAACVLSIPTLIYVVIDDE